MQQNPFFSKTAIALYSKTFVYSIIKFNDISSFWQNARLGVADRFEKLFSQYLNFNKDFFANPENEKFFIDRSARDELLNFHGGIIGFTGQMAKNSTDNFVALIDSSCIVFAHSILDGAAFNFCRVAFLVDPKSWEKYVLKQKVDLTYLREKTVEQILKEKTQEHLEDFDRKSLISKTDRLFDI